MNVTSIKCILSLGLLATTLMPSAGAEPNADQLLREMSSKLAAARTFSFKAVREIDPALLEGRNVPEKARISVVVQRPNKLSGEAVSKDDARRFVFDGRNLTLFDEKNHYYAVIPMQTSLDGLVDQLDQKYGFTPPLAEFAVSDPYADFHRQAQTVTYLGQGKSNGVECHHLGLKGNEADAELWIAVSDQLPRALVATFHRVGQPQLRITFSAWNLAASASASQFTFAPPKGTEKIEMWTTGKMLGTSKP